MIVIDCCAAFEMCRSTEVGRALRSLVLEEETIIAPELYKAEVANVLWKYVQQGMMSLEEAQKKLRALISLVDVFVPAESNLLESLAEAARLDHPVYGLLYLTAARRNAATLMSVDKRLNALCDECGVARIYKMDV